jgi:hypothetical protein
MATNKPRMSYYDSMFVKEKKDIDITNYIGFVQHGTNQDLVIKARALKQAGNLEEYKKLKSKSKVVTGSAVLNDGDKSEKNIKSLNGLIVIDIDGQLNDDLKNDKYTYIYHKSFGGDGLCIFVRINPDKFEDSFNGLADYYFKNYNVTIDQACKNKNRLRYVSFDPDIYVNDNANKFIPKDVKRFAEPKLTSFIYTKSDFDNILDQIKERQIDLCNEDYHTYIRIGLALHDKFGLNGEEYFHFICNYGAKYNIERASKDWKGLCKNSSGKVKIGTFYYYCKQANINIYSEKTKQIINRVKISKTQGNPTIESVSSNLLNANEITVNDEDKLLIKELIESKTDYSIEANIDKTEIEQLEDLIIDTYEPKIDEITNITYILNQIRLSDNEVNSIYLTAKKSFTFNVNMSDIRSILNSNRVKKFNTLNQFLKENESNPVGIIDQYVKCITPYSDYNVWAFKKWLVGMVHNWTASMNEKLVCPLTLVLTGQQHGTGKCLGKNTPVLMFDGSIKMVQDILIGDKIMGPDGSIRNIISLANGSETMYRVSQNKSDSYIVNESHIISLKNRDNHNVVNVSIMEYLNWSPTKKYRHVGYRGQIINTNDSSLKISPYLFGLWLGDGVTKIKEYGFCIENMDKEIIDFIYNYSEIINHKVSVNENKKSKSNGYRLVLNKGKDHGKSRDPKHIKHIFSEYGLTSSKFIPFDFKFSSKKQRLELLAGLIDSDGSKSSNCNYEITQKSLLLSNDIVFLCRSLGFRAVMSKKIINKTTYYRISISGNLQEVPVLLERKKINTKNYYRPDYSSIKVDKLNIDEYYGFDIDGDKLFMLGDFTVTHNTSWLRNIMPDDLEKYVIETKINGQDKDSVYRLCSSLLIIDDEFGGKAFKDVKEYKAISDTNIVTQRRPYGREDDTFKRRAGLAGTTNETDILKDVTGNRRILPITVESIDYDKMLKINKVDLIIEAYNLLKNGFEWILRTNEEIEYLRTSSIQNETILPIEEIFFKHFSPEPTSYFLLEKVWNQGEILEYLNNHSVLKPTKYDLKEVLVKNKMVYRSWRSEFGVVKSGIKLWTRLEETNSNISKPF